jgi:hypothetical protein
MLPIYISNLENATPRLEIITGTGQLTVWYFFIRPRSSASRSPTISSIDHT